MSLSVSRTALALLTVLAASATACAAAPRDGEVTGSVASALGNPPHGDRFFGDTVSFPFLSSAQLGVGYDAVNALRDPDPNAVMIDRVKEMYPNFPRPKVTADVSTWATDWDGSYKCYACSLDGMELKAPAGATVKITTSSAEGTKFPAGVTWSLDTVYARGASFAGTSIELHALNTQLRGASFGGKVHLTGGVVELAGTSGLDLEVGASSVFLNASAGAKVHVPPGQTTSLRLDAMTDADIRLEGTLAGQFFLYGFQGTITLDGGGFAGGKFFGGDGKGRILVTSKGGHFTGVDLYQFGGRALPLDPTGGPVTITQSTLVVGNSGIVTDDQLAKIDLTGTNILDDFGGGWPAKPLDLTGLRLAHGAFPPNADLSKVVLDGAHLERVNFATATLSKDGKGTSFRGAHLSRASFAHKEIFGVDFTEADLRGANLYHVTGNAKLDGVKADILAAGVDDNDTPKDIPTVFAEAELSTSTFTGASLQYADFTHANIAATTLDGADFTWATFRAAIASEHDNGNASLKKATLLGTHWDGADLRHVDLTGVSFAPAKGVRSTFDDALLCGATLTNTILHDASLRGALFDVDGQVRLPDGSWITCKPGDRTGVNTSSTDPKLGTLCPSSGDAPAGADGQCSDAQWKVTGGTPDACTSKDQSSVGDGGSCTLDCQCQSAFCAADHTCQEPSAK